MLGRRPAVGQVVLSESVNATLGEWLKGGRGLLGRVRVLSWRMQSSAKSGSLARRTSNCKTLCESQSPRDTGTNRGCPTTDLPGTTVSTMLRVRSRLVAAIGLLAYLTAISHASQVGDACFEHHISIGDNCEEPCDSDCPCCPADTPQGSCPCSDSCPMCNVAKALCIALELSPSLTAAPTGACTYEEAFVYLPPSLSGLLRPPRL
jgi:hypothetical protein